MNLRHALILAVLGLCLFTPASGAEPVDFQRHIAPLLVRRCLACHGEQKFKGEYQMHTLTSLLRAGASGEAAIVPGQPDASYLLKLVQSTDANERMPQGAEKLSEAECDLLRRWIAAGATFGAAAPEAFLVNVAHWRHPAPPEKYRRPFPITAVAFDPSGQELAVGGQHEVTIWSVVDGTLLRRLPGIAERTYALAYTRDGSQLVVAGGAPAQLGEVRLLSAAQGELLRHFGSFSDCALTAALSPQEDRLAVAGADNIAHVYEVATGKEQLRIKDHSDWIMALAWSPDGSRLATASRDKTCKVFSSQTGELVTTFAEQGEPVLSVVYQSDGKQALSAGADGRIRYWVADDPGWENPQKMDKKKRHQVAEITGFNGPVQRLVMGQGSLFAVASDHSVRQFDLAKRNTVRSFAGHQEALFAADYHAGSKRLATAGLDGQVRIWQTDAKDEKTWTVATFLAAPGYPQPATTTNP